jgi:hypothetical protein
VEEHQHCERLLFPQVLVCVFVESLALDLLADLFGGPHFWRCSICVVRPCSLAFSLHCVFFRSFRSCGPQIARTFRTRLNSPVCSSILRSSWLRGQYTVMSIGFCLVVRPLLWCLVRLCLFRLRGLSLHLGLALASDFVGSGLQCLLFMYAVLHVVCSVFHSALFAAHPLACVFLSFRQGLWAGVYERPSILMLFGAVRSSCCVCLQLGGVC